MKPLNPMIIILSIVAITTSCYSLAYSQTYPAWELFIYERGTDNQIDNGYGFNVNLVTCNQDPPDPNLPNLNPTRIVFDDKDNAGKVCWHVAVPGAPLLNLPDGLYDAGLIEHNQFGASVESVRAPFAVGQSPDAPSGLRLVRP